MLNAFKDLYNSNLIDLQMRLQLLYGNAMGGLFITFLCMSVLCFGFETQENQSLKTFVWIALVISHAFRAIDNLYTRKYCLPEGKGLRGAAIRFSVGIIANSVIWATYSLLFVANMGTLEVTLTAIILSALAGGTITILAGSFSLSIFYMSALILPWAIVSFFNPIDDLFYISTMGAVFWLVMVVSGKEASGFVSQVLDLKSKNMHMLKEIANEKKEIERVNNELSKANEKLDNYANKLESEVAKRTDEIYRLSNLDPLTNLNNRTAFLQELEYRFKQNAESNYSLLFIDLDGFKDVNDGFGHKVGDAVLIEVAKRLSNLENVFCGCSNHTLPLKRADHLCRWGGDEFLVLSKLEPDFCLEDVVNLIQKRVKEPMVIASNKITIGCSIGIASYPQDSSCGSELIQYADIAMYHNKKSKGEVATHFCSSLLEEFQRDQFIRDGLKDAICNNEFNLVFQPIVDVQKEKVWAFEALLRWQHKGQFIGPHEFIPIAEKSGYVVEIGRWVLFEAMRQAKNWNVDDQPSLSVNVSSLQLIDPRFIDNLDLALQESGWPTSKLHLEITESLMIEDDSIAKDNLAAIVARGIHISVDDFGTGYSSLHQLQSLSFNVIKLDRSFVHNLTAADSTIISATKVIADEFNAVTVAEGIETEHELGIMKELGINHIQGYFFARPMPASAIISWYKDDYCKNHKHAELTE